METQAIPRTIKQVFDMLPQGTLAQLINNNIIMSPAPTEAHQRMLIFLSTEINVYVRKNKLGRVYFSPLDVELNYGNVYQPDLLFISNENAGIIHQKRIYGAPDLVIEILSSGTEKYDLGKKLEVYEKSGVQEYIIIDLMQEKPTAKAFLSDVFKTQFKVEYENSPVITIRTLNNLQINLEEY
jgi:Uma2 family endonuclease